MRIIFLYLQPFKDLQFHRICFVTGVLNYVYVCCSGASHIRQVSVDSELASCKI